ncbi:MAG: HigA family addiction module antitoxin [Cytophagales bacterium]|nr:HigA family addiction module antitoxin [Cytophagales bacterium]
MHKPLLDEIHPGEILLEDFMRPMNITARQISSDMDVPPSRISDIVNGARPITADTALRLGLFFGMDARYWLNLQSEYDVRVAKRDLLEGMKARVRIYQHATNDPNAKLAA